MRSWTVGHRALAASLAVAAGLVALLAMTLTGSPSDAPGPAATAPAAESPLIGPIADGLVQRDLAPGEVPAEEHGILFVNVESGAGELWTYPGAGSAFVDYDVDPSHRWLLVHRPGPDGKEWLVADRATGESYRVDPGGWKLVEGGSPTPHHLKPTTAGLLALESASLPGRYAVADLANQPTRITREFALPPSVHSPPPVLLRGEQRVVIGFSVVNLTTGEVAPLPEAAGIFSRSATDSGGWVEVGASAAGSAGRDIGTLFVRRFDASANLLGEFSLPGGFQPALGFGQQPSAEGVQVSPNGRWLAWQGSLPLRSPAFTEIWPIVTIADLDAGRIVLRVVRASLRVRASGQLWFNDSSGLVLDTPIRATILDPASGNLEQLPFESAPLVSPGTSSLLLEGQVFNIGGQPLTPPVAAYSWLGWEPRDEYGLDAMGRELRVERSAAGGRDWTILVLTPVGIPARLEAAPFAASDEIQLRVKAGTGGLNLRDSPSVSGALIKTLGDRALVLVTTDPESMPSSALERGITHEPFYAVPWWLHVRSDDGVEGWVRSEYLDWVD